MILGLIQNLALLLALAYGVQLLARRLRGGSLSYQVAMGLLFGVVACVGMATPFELRPGVIYDGRSVVLSLAGLFGGPFAALLAAVIAAAYRLQIGGAGAFAGVLVIAGSAALGTLLYALRRRDERWVRLPGLALFGAASAFLMLGMQFLVPDMDVATLVRTIGPTVVVAYPAAFVLMAWILLEGERDRLRERALAETDERLQLALEGGRLGTWDWYIPEDRVIYDAYWAQTIGVSLEELGHASSAWSERLHPDDRQRVLAALEAHLEGHAQVYETEQRIRHAEGHYVWVLGRGRVIERDAAGRPLRACGTVLDITPQKKTEQELAAAKQRLEAAMSAGMIGWWEWDLESNEVFFSEEWRAQIGYGPDEIPNEFSEWEKRVHPEDLSPTVGRIRRAIREGAERFENTFRFRHREGHYIWLHTRAATIKNATGKIIRVLGSHFDITAAKQAEEALRQSEERYRALIEAQPDLLFRIDRDGLFLDVVAKDPELLAVPPSQIIEHSVDEVLPQHLAAQARQKIDETLSTGQMQVYDYAIAIEGEKRLFEARMVTCGQNEVLIIAREVSEKKRAEAALAESERRHRSLFSYAPEAIFVVSGGRIAYANSACARLLGLGDPARLSGAPLADFVDPSEADFLLARLRELEGSEEPSEPFEQLLRDEKGAPLPVEMRTVAFEHEGNPATLVFARDLRSRKRAEAERERLIAAIERAGETVMILDTEGRISYVNRAFEELSGYLRDEIRGHGLDLLAADEAARAQHTLMWERLGAGSAWHGQARRRRKDGTTYTGEATVSPVLDALGRRTGYVLLERDITHERALEEQLRQAQKLESIGRLAGGVAHDFNNMLNVILGHAELAMEAAGQDAELREDLGEIQRAAERSADLTRQLLAFARRQSASPVTLELNEAIGGMLKLLRRLIGEDIELAFTPAPGELLLQIDRSQLDQILANLVVNARDAIEGGGSITIRTDAERIGTKERPERLPIPVGEYVLLEIRDTGIGMNAETAAHIFEPFFTTKRQGEGTGLGLATVYGIVKQNEGFIDVESAPGEGALFRLYFPRLAERLSDVEEPSEGAGAPAAGVGTVLLVEDEPALLGLTERQLRRLGYGVIAASSPREALELARTHVGEIDMLLTDVVMPGMNGRDLWLQITQLRPGLPCLLMSGYAAEGIVDPAEITPPLFFVPKPFDISTLAQRVREALEFVPREP